MQRPPEYPDVDTDISADKPLSEEDLKFFGLSERKKDQESLDLEELRVLKKKTEELTKTPEKPDLKTPKKPEPVTPEKPKSAEAEKTELSKTEISKPEKPEVPKSDSKIVTSPASPDAVKTPVVQKPAAVTNKDARYTVQVFASRKHENAKKLVEKLRKNGFDDAFIFQHTAGNKTLYRVRVGKLERSETKELANKLKNLKYIDSVQITRF
jgi:cell division protein FtsN